MADPFHFYDMDPARLFDFKPNPKADAVRRLADEKARAEAAMAERFANLHMPEDIRSRARAWGMEAFCVVLWNNAFQAGWREAKREQAEIQNRKEEGNG